MKKILLSLLTVLALGAPLRAQTLDEVLARHYQARGGLDKLTAVSGLKLSGRLAVAAQGLELPVVIWRKAPDRMRVETLLQGKTIVQACAGGASWWLMPFLFEGAQAMPAEQGAPFCERAAFADPLVAFAEKGQALELLGREELDGTPAFKLKRVKADGIEYVHYLDAASGLELKSLRAGSGASAGALEILYGDYRPVSGVMMPFTVENRLNGRLQARLTFDAIEIDPAMEDSLFAMPADKAARAGKKAPGKKAAAAGKGGK